MTRQVRRDDSIARDGLSKHVFPVVTASSESMEEQQRLSAAGIVPEQRHAPILSCSRTNKQTIFFADPRPLFLYSARKPSTGSTRIARSAGGTHAMIAATSNSALALASAIRSVVVTP